MKKKFGWKRCVVAPANRLTPEDPVPPLVIAIGALDKKYCATITHSIHRKGLWQSSRPQTNSRIPSSYLTNWWRSAFVLLFPVLRAALALSTNHSAGVFQLCAIRLSTPLACVWICERGLTQWLWPGDRGIRLRWTCPTSAPQSARAFGRCCKKTFTFVSVRSNV